MRGILRSDRFTTALHGNCVPSVSNLGEKNMHYFDDFIFEVFFATLYVSDFQNFYLLLKMH